MLRVGDGVTDNVLEEDLENAAGLLVDETGDALDATTAGETANGGLGDALDVVAQDLPVAFGASLAEALASLSASRHVFLKSLDVNPVNSDGVKMGAASFIL